MPAMTQFGRALAELNIEIICANSSQAKGRVERANRTLQDRLVKELRIENVSSIDPGNAFLPGLRKPLQRAVRSAAGEDQRPAPGTPSSSQNDSTTSSATASSAMSATSSPWPTNASS